MFDSRYRMMRHIETVRNYINTIVKELINRQEQHDQSKFESPEEEIFVKYTPKIRKLLFNSKEYKKYVKIMTPAINHHRKYNRHHIEYFKNGIKDMNLIDLTELICDWKAASIRNNKDNILNSIEINQNIYGYSDEVKEILKNTAKLLNKKYTYHKGIES